MTKKAGHAPVRPPHVGARGRAAHAELLVRVHSIHSIHSILGKTPSRENNEKTMKKRLEQLDRQLSSALYRAFHARPAVSAPVSALCRVLEWSGDGRLWFALWALGVFLVGTSWGEIREIREPSLETVSSALKRLLALLLVDLVLVGGLKWAVKRRRPSYGRAPAGYVVEVDRYSFPSGHASRAMAIAAGLFVDSEKWAWAWAWALLVGASRVAYGRHWVGDVAGGWAGGWAVGMAVRSMYLVVFDS